MFMLISKKAIEAVSVASEYPQDGRSVCCCYDDCVDTQPQNWVVRCVLRVIACVISYACRAEPEYSQNGGRKKTGGRRKTANAHIYTREIPESAPFLSWHEAQSGGLRRVFSPVLKVTVIRQVRMSPTFTVVWAWR